MGRAPSRAIAMGSGEGQLITREALLASMGVLQALGDNYLHGILDFDWLKGLPRVSNGSMYLRLEFRKTARPPQQFKRGEDILECRMIVCNQSAQFKHGDPASASAAIKCLLDVYVEAYEAAGWDSEALRGCNAYYGKKYIDPFTEPAAAKNHGSHPVLCSALTAPRYCATAGCFVRMPTGYAGAYVSPRFTERVSSYVSGPGICSCSFACAEAYLLHHSKAKLEFKPAAMKASAVKNPADLGVESSTAMWGQDGFNLLAGAVEKCQLAYGYQPTLSLLCQYRALNIIYPSDTVSPAETVVPVVGMPQSGYDSAELCKLHTKIAKLKIHKALCEGQIKL